jgi:hypothetical protein
MYEYIYTKILSMVLDLAILNRMHITLQISAVLF